MILRHRIRFLLAADASEDAAVSITMQYVEIYNERIRICSTPRTAISTCARRRGAHIRRWRQHAHGELAAGLEAAIYRSNLYPRGRRM